MREGSTAQTIQTHGCYDPPPIEKVQALTFNGGGLVTALAPSGWQKGLYVPSDDLSLHLEL